MADGCRGATGGSAGGIAGPGRPNSSGRDPLSANSMSSSIFLPGSIPPPSSQALEQRKGVGKSGRCAIRAHEPFVPMIVSHRIARRKVPAVGNDINSRMSEMTDSLGFDEGLPTALCNDRHRSAFEGSRPRFIFQWVWATGQPEIMRNRTREKGDLR
jgi:hypothetical protein